MRGGASTGAADLFGVASTAGGSASFSTMAEVVTKVTNDVCHNVTTMCQNMCQDVTMCKNVTTMCQNMVMKSLDVERDVAAAAQELLEPATALV